MEVGAQRRLQAFARVPHVRFGEDAAPAQNLLLNPQERVKRALRQHQNREVAVEEAASAVAVSFAIETQHVEKHLREPGAGHGSGCAPFELVKEVAPAGASPTATPPRDGASTRG